MNVLRSRPTVSVSMAEPVALDEMPQPSRDSLTLTQSGLRRQTSPGRAMRYPTPRTVSM